MTPERAEALLRAVVGSVGAWVEEIESLEGRCPGEFGHLLASMKQARSNLIALLEQD